MSNWISAQVVISQFVGWSPTLGYALTVWSLLGILSLSPSLSLFFCPSLAPEATSSFKAILQSVLQYYSI
ncbi:Hypothetical predicted protein [Lynx pardinus]|uniref:Uncharacterized protein n=1 Tax=Lynx pardinus TaxID=191816 RepID=A0A485PIE1_LYNPA|nr:Hypothetical predicted protein [Lynx pardinus]